VPGRRKHEEGGAYLRHRRAAAAARAEQHEPGVWSLALLPPSALAKGKGGVEEMELGRRPRELPWPSTVLFSSSAATLCRSSSGVRESQQLGRRRTGRGARGLGERMRSDWARRLGFRSTDLGFYMAGAERPKIPLRVEIHCLTQMCTDRDPSRSGRQAGPRDARAQTQPDAGIILQPTQPAASLSTNIQRTRLTRLEDPTVEKLKSL
jgi:hypothetical protein